MNRSNFLQPLVPADTDHENDLESCPPRSVRGKEIGLGDVSWNGEIDAPAFKAFRHKTSHADSSAAGSKYALSIWGGKVEDAPPESAITLATEFLARQNEIVDAVATAFCDEFHGRGLDSGMWWFNGLNREDAAWVLQGRTFNTPDDMLAALQLTGIIIRNDMDGVDGYIAHLCFHADFEEEHGVGVLTDVRKVLGTGYLEDVTPYGFKYDET